MIKIITKIKPKVYSVEIPDSPTDGRCSEGWAIEIIPRKFQGVPKGGKDCFCHTCSKDIHHLGIARHRAMHRDKKQDCKITFSTGKTVRWDYSHEC